MAVAVDDNNGIWRITLAGDLTICTAAETKTQLMGGLKKLHLNNASVVEIDLGSVEEIDTSGLQLLIGLDREFRLHNVTTYISSVSDAAQVAIDLYNLWPHLGWVAEATSEVVLSTQSE